MNERVQVPAFNAPEKTQATNQVIDGWDIQSGEPTDSTFNLKKNLLVYWVLLSSLGSGMADTGILFFCSVLLK